MDLPHQYIAATEGGPEGPVSLSAGTAPPVASMPPPQFGGPEGYWNPEQLLVAAVANCFLFTFRALAKASGLQWMDIDVQADGTLDREGRNICFTRVDIYACLQLPEGGDRDVAEKLLHRAEDKCLISNSLSCQKVLHISFK